MTAASKEDDNLKAKLVKDTVKYSTSTFLSQFITFFRSIIVARYLGPAKYGLWNALSLILEYSRYSDFGTKNALNREVPFYRGKGDFKRANEIKNVVFSMVVIPSLLIALAIFFISFIAADKYSLLAINGLRAVAILVVLQQLYLYYQILFRCHNEFSFLSKLLVFFSIVNLILVSILVVKFNFIGLLWAMILGYILTLGIIYKYKSVQLRLRFKSKTIFSLMKIGAPIILIAILTSLFYSTERFVIIKFLGLTSLGYYGLALLVSRLILLIPGAASTIIYPRLNERYGASNKDIGALKKYITIPAVILAYLMPLLLGLVYFALPLGVKVLLPKYMPGLNASRIVVLGVFFSCIVATPANFLVVINKMFQLLVVLSFALLTRFAIDLAFIKLGMGLVGVAIGGPLIVTFLYSTFIIGYVLSHYFKGFFSLLKFFAKIYFPFLYFIVVILILDHFIKGTLTGLWTDIYISLLKMLIFTILCLPLLWYVNKETGILTQIFSILKQKIQLRKSL